jgi:hypothetical protein
MSTIKMGEDKEDDLDYSDPKRTGKVKLCDF